jgi:periplasmic protein CpxP/Spy
MNSKLKSSLFAACAVMTLSGGVVYATDSTHSKPAERHGQMHRHGHGAHGGGSALMGTLKQLDLTAEQQQSVRSVFQSTADQRKALAEQSRANRAALASTLPDDPKYPALIAERKQLAAQRIQQSSDTESQIYALLTPEQKAKVPQLLAERKARWEERRQQWQNRNSAAS